MYLLSSVSGKSANWKHFDIFSSKECSNNDYIEGKNTIASISTSLPLPRIFIFHKIDVSNVINKSITVETNKCPLGNCLAMVRSGQELAERDKEIVVKVVMLLCETMRRGDCLVQLSEGY